MHSERELVPKKSAPTIATAGPSDLIQWGALQIPCSGTVDSLITWMNSLFGGLARSREISIQPSVFSNEKATCRRRHKSRRTAQNSLQKSLLVGNAAGFLQRVEDHLGSRKSAVCGRCLKFATIRRASKGIVIYFLFARGPLEETCSKT